MNNLTLVNFSTSPSYYEVTGLSNTLTAYKDLYSDHSADIEEVGFNPDSGYVYLAMSNGITICSMLGQQAEYFVTDFNDGTEYFFTDIEEAFSKLEELN